MCVMFALLKSHVHIHVTRMHGKNVVFTCVVVVCMSWHSLNDLTFWIFVPWENFIVVELSNKLSLEQEIILMDYHHGKNISRLISSIHTYTHTHTHTIQKYEWVVYVYMTYYWLLTDWILLTLENPWQLRWNF